MKGLPEASRQSGCVQNGFDPATTARGGDIGLTMSLCELEPCHLVSATNPYLLEIFGELLRLSSMVVGVLIGVLVGVLVA